MTALWVFKVLLHGLISIQTHISGWPKGCVQMNRCDFRAKSAKLWRTLMTAMPQPASRSDDEIPGSENPAACKFSMIALHSACGSFWYSCAVHAIPDSCRSHCTCHRCALIEAGRRHWLCHSLKKPSTDYRDLKPTKFPKYTTCSGDCAAIGVAK